MTTTAIKGLVRLARPADWVKNMFVVPALLASGKASDPKAVWCTVVAFASFSCVASGVYCINDALDRHQDRHHPVKRNRPIPAGLVSPTAAYVSGFAWIALGLLITAPAESWELAATLACYLGLQVAYNAVLKRVNVVDVVALSLGFVLRAIAGACAVGVPASLWLVSSVFFLCLFLAQIKRLCDLVSINQTGGVGTATGQAGLPGWQPPAGYRSAEELRWMLACSSALAILTFLAYAMSSSSTIHPGVGVHGFVLLTPLPVISMFRFYRAASRGGYDSPLMITLTEPIIITSNALFAAGAIWMLYAPWGRELLLRLFLLES